MNQSGGGVFFAHIQLQFAHFPMIFRFSPCFLQTAFCQDRPGKRVPVETHFIVVVDISGSMCETLAVDQ